MYLSASERRGFMRKIEFSKMHGIGNDYIYINCMDKMPDGIPQLAVEMSRRHFSVGADGIVCICKPSAGVHADAKMRMFNADGSEGKMCGNAIRCVGKYLYDRGIAKKEELSIETLSGIKHLRLTVENGECTAARVDMGKAILSPADIPVKFDGARMINESVRIAGSEYKLTAVSMGNPHAVIFTDEVKSLNLEKIGPLFENDPIFPERVNTEFVRVIDRENLEMRVWERGSGETYACGTGACASAAAAVLNGCSDFDSPIKVHLIGGELTISVGSDLRVTMTGPAELVYNGVYYAK